MSSLSLYTSDVIALARKDLKLELRARDTLPAMLLFVLSTLAVFHFALPAGTGEDAAYGLLWIAIIFTACSASPGRGRPSATVARSTASFSRRATAARSGSASLSPRWPSSPQPSS